MSVYDRYADCPCGAEVLLPPNAGEGTPVTCPHCGMALTFTEDGDFDSERGWRDLSRLIPVEG